jgi:cell division septal protein FtsQ
VTDLLRPAAPERPRVDPRIARRWIDARREEGRRRLHLLVAAGSALAVAGLAAGSLLTPLFAVRHVRVSVSGPVSPAAVRALAGLDGHLLMIHVDPAAISSRLDSDPWLGAARVARHWPSTVTVGVVVRTPIAVIGGGPGAAGEWAEVDPTGRVLADVPVPPPGTPVLQGVGSAPVPGRWLVGAGGPGMAPGALPSAGVDTAAPSDSPDMPAGAAAALAFLQALPASLRPDVTWVRASAGTGLSLAVAPPRSAAGTITVSLGDGSELQAKVAALVTLLDQADLAGVGSVDLSVPSRPAVSATARVGP